MSKRVLKLTEHAKAGLEEQNKGPKKRKNDEKGGKAMPKKARPDQQSGSDNTNSVAEKPSQAATPSALPGAQAIDTDDANTGQDVSSDGLKIIEPHTLQSKERMGKRPDRGNEDDKGKLKCKVKSHQLTTERQ